MTGAWGKLFRKGKKEKPMPQSEEDRERRELTDRLIDEHRNANSRAREQVQHDVPAMNSRYLATMTLATNILKGR
jgi:hypothetical protein